jgi:hypothetical protein
LLVTEGSHDRAAEELVRRLVTFPLKIDKDRVANPNVRAFHGKGQGFFKRAVRWILESRKRGFDALILIIDRDGDPERVRQIDRAQTWSDVEIRRALGVAIESFDAWILADEKALTRILGRRVDTQKNPESIYPPKEVCEKLGILRRDLCQEVCRINDIELLSLRCAGGFAQFAQRVRALAAGI